MISNKVVPVYSYDNPQAPSVESFQRSQVFSKQGPFENLADDARQLGRYKSSLQFPYDDGILPRQRKLSVESTASLSMYIGVGLQPGPRFCKWVFFQEAFIHRTAAAVVKSDKISTT